MGIDTLGLKATGTVAKRSTERRTRPVIAPRKTLEC